MYPDGEYDLAGFCVGVVEKSPSDRRRAIGGDAVLGLASSGAHSNGYSLIRRFSTVRGPTSRRTSRPPLADVLLAPTRTT